MIIMKGECPCLAKFSHHSMAKACAVIMYLKLMMFCTVCHLCLGLLDVYPPHNNIKSEFIHNCSILNQPQYECSTENISGGQKIYHSKDHDVFDSGHKIVMSWFPKSACSMAMQLFLFSLELTTTVPHPTTSVYGGMAVVLHGFVRVYILTHGGTSLRSSGTHTIGWYPLIPT